MRPMNPALRLGCSLGLVLSVACGPAGLKSSEAGDESTDSGTPSESESGEAGTTDTGSSDTEPGTTFISEPADQLNDDTCDSFAQDCPEGEKCVPFAYSGDTWDANKCVPVLGDGAPGDPCSYAGVVESTDDCGADSFCWDLVEVEGELTGTCAQFCTGTADAPECPESHDCMINSLGVFNLCIPVCDPVAQDCDPGLGCYWTGGEFRCELTGRNIPAGEPCGSLNGCAPGLGCLPAEVLPACAGSTCCSPYCDLGLGDAQCLSVAGTSCVSYFEEGMAPPGYEHVGVCILP